MSKEKLYKIVGENVKRFRKQETNLNQEGLAKIVNVSRSTIAALESSRCQGVSVYVLYKIAKVLGKDMDEFFI